MEQERRNARMHIQPAFFWTLGHTPPWSHLPNQRSGARFGGRPSGFGFVFTPNRLDPCRLRPISVDSSPKSIPNRPCCAPLVISVIRTPRRHDGSPISLKRVWCAHCGMNAPQSSTSARACLLGRVCCWLGWLRCCLVARHGVRGRPLDRPTPLTRSLAYPSQSNRSSICITGPSKSRAEQESSATHGAAGGGAAAAGTGAGGRGRGGRGATAPVARGELCFGCGSVGGARATRHTGHPSISPHHPPTTPRPPNRIKSNSTHAIPHHAQTHTQLSTAYGRHRDRKHRRFVLGSWKAREQGQPVRCVLLMKGRGCWDICLYIPLTYLLTYPLTHSNTGRCLYPSLLTHLLKHTHTHTKYTHETGTSSPTWPYPGRTASTSWAARPSLGRRPGRGSPPRRRPRRGGCVFGRVGCGWIVGCV